MSDWDPQPRLEVLAARGVRVVDPRQTYVDEQVRLDRVRPGAVLHPGARLSGARTWLSPGAEVGRHGPVVLENCVLGERARVDGGYARGAVLLRDAGAGAGAHLRDGTLLEEDATTAHCVGLKHTILLSFVTVGSLVNLCDALIAGGTSRRDHSEVGSGFIHFNFTPWGERGDKATPSVMGDVIRGVFLRQRRIFLGGAGGMVGPRTVGYGSVVGAGQVLRRDVAENRIVVDPWREVELEHEPDRLDEAPRRARPNLAYIGQLVALATWYRQVRLARAEDRDRPVLEAAADLLDGAIEERSARLASFLAERGHSMPPVDRTPAVGPCPLSLAGGPSEHVEWVQGLSAADVEVGRDWLLRVVQHSLASVPDDLRPGLEPAPWP